MASDMADHYEKNDRSSWSKRVTSAGIAVITLVMGTALPVLTGPKTELAWVNVVWGSVYGIGFWILSPLPYIAPGPINFIVTLFGMFIWPAAVAIAVYKVSLRAEGDLSRKALLSWLPCLVVSLVWNVQTSKMAQSLLYYLPIYSAFLNR